MSNSQKRSSSSLFVILKQANKLVLWLLGALIGIAVVVFFLFDAIGWGGTGVRAMVAMLVSPLIVIVLAGGAWLYWRAGEPTTSFVTSDVEEETINGSIN